MARKKVTKVQVEDVDVDNDPLIKAADAYGKPSHSYRMTEEKRQEMIKSILEKKDKIISFIKQEMCPNFGIDKKSIKNRVDFIAKNKLNQENLVKMLEQERDCEYAMFTVCALLCFIHGLSPIALNFDFSDAVTNQDICINDIIKMNGNIDSIVGKDKSIYDTGDTEELRRTKVKKS